MLVNPNPTLSPRASAAQRWGFMPRQGRFYCVEVDYRPDSDEDLDLEERHIALVSSEHLGEVMRVPLGNGRVKYLFRHYDDFLWFQYKVYLTL